MEEMDIWCFLINIFDYNRHNIKIRSLWHGLDVLDSDQQEFFKLLL